MLNPENKKQNNECMRTAQSYLEEKFPNAAHLDWFKPIVEIINTSRREAIKEAAEVARTKFYACGDPNTCGCMGTCEHPVTVFDKQSILSLINQIK